MKKSLTKAFTQALKVLLSVGIITWLVQSDKLDFSSLKSFLDPRYLLLGLGLILLNNFIVSERWRSLLKSQGARISIFEAFKLTQIGLFFNFAMPGGVGGDVIKAYYFNKIHKHSPLGINTKVVAITSVLMDRVIGLYAMIVMAFVSMSFDIKHVLSIETLTHLFYFVFALFMAFSIGLALVFSSLIYNKGYLTKIITYLPLSQKFQKLYENLHLYGKDGLTFSKTFLFSLLAQSASILFLIMAGAVTNIYELNWTTYFLVAPLGYMATAIPISPAGVGVGQAAFYFLFNIYTNRDSELGPTLITSFQVFSFMTSLLGALFYLKIKEKTPIENYDLES